MHPSRFALLLLATLALVPPPAPAQEQGRMTIDQAVALALRANHDVLRAREQLNRQTGQIEEVKSQVYPQVGLESAYQRSYDESPLDSELAAFIPIRVTDSYAIRTTLHQLVFSWGKVSAAVDIAQASLAQTRENVTSTERTVKFSVHDAFYALLLSERLVEVAEERLAQRERVLNVAQKRFEAGVVNEFEVIRARVDVANARTPVIQARNQVRQAKARLNNLLARNQAAPIEAEGTLEHLPMEDLTLDQVIERAVAQRPELEALRIGRDIAEKNLEIARAGDKPEVNLDAAYGFATQEFEHLNTDREQWSAGMSLKLPLFDGWRTRGQVAQARSQIQDVQLATAQLRESITLDAKVALDAMHEAEDIISAAALNIEEAQKALELAETSYRYGVAILLDVTDAQLALTAARVDYATSLRNYMSARARVLSIMNEL
jgi:HAE1 family hydrophobic/amphiphilic exporter-1